MADPMTDGGLDNATLGGAAAGFTSDDAGNPNADVANAEAAVEEAIAENASPEEIAQLRAEVRKAQDRIAGHKGEATQAKERARRLEEENARLQQQLSTYDQRLNQFEQQLTRRNAEVAEVETRAKQTAYLRERTYYWQQRGYEDDVAQSRAQDDLAIQVRYDEVEARRRTTEEERAVIAQQKQEAMLESAITREIREAIADAKDDGLTIHLTIADIKDEIQKRFVNKRFNEADIARVVAKQARQAIKDAEATTSKAKRAAARAQNREADIASGATDFEDGGSAGISFDELEARYAAGDNSLFNDYQKALKKRGLA
jgi:chromosome segregation ATPase